MLAVKWSLAHCRFRALLIVYGAFMQCSHLLPTCRDVGQSRGGQYASLPQIEAWPPASQVRQPRSLLCMYVLLLCAPQTRICCDISLLGNSRRLDGVVVRAKCLQRLLQPAMLSGLSLGATIWKPSTAIKASMGVLACAICSLICMCM